MVFRADLDDAILELERVADASGSHPGDLTVQFRFRGPGLLAHAAMTCPAKALDGFGRRLQRPPTAGQTQTFHVESSLRPAATLTIVAEGGEFRLHALLFATGSRSALLLDGLAVPLRHVGRLARWCRGVARGSDDA